MEPREQIIKALECISSKEDVLCEGCAYQKHEGFNCRRNAAKDALSLIKELTEENERLHTACTELAQCCTKLETLYKIECKRVDTIKVDTVRKMQERLLQLFPCDKNYTTISRFTINQLAKEMMEE